MMSIKDLIIQEINQKLKDTNLKAIPEFLGNELVVTIPKQEVEKIMMQTFPEQLKNLVQIECGEIKIKVKVM